MHERRDRLQRIGQDLDRILSVRSPQPIIEQQRVYGLPRCVHGADRFPRLPRAQPVEVVGADDGAHLLQRSGLEERAADGAHLRVPAVPGSVSGGHANDPVCSTTNGPRTKALCRSAALSAANTRRRGLRHDLVAASAPSATSSPLPTAQ